MQGKAPFILIGLLARATLGARAVSQGGAEATEVSPPTPMPIATSTQPPPLIPTVPSSVDSFEDLAAIFNYDREVSLGVDLQYGYYDRSILPDLAAMYVDEASEPKLARWYHTGHALNTLAFLDRAGWPADRLGLDTAPLARFGVEE
ncbi:MAG TPA: hypothetical protein ENI37_03630 [Chloroflexi bacterium]|nr:hypothetical protein [Chloroflexota bacterium]